MNLEIILDARESSIGRYLLCNNRKHIFVRIFSPRFDLFQKL